MNADWKENHQRLKEALVLHNRWKCHENAKKLEGARAWAAAGLQILPSSDNPFFEPDDAAHDEAYAAVLEAGGEFFDFEGDGSRIHSMVGEFTSEEGPDVPLSMTHRSMDRPFSQDSVNAGNQSSSTAFGNDPEGLTWGTAELDAAARCTASTDMWSTTSSFGGPPAATLRPIVRPARKKWQHRMGSFVSEVMQATTIDQRHTQPPFWYRCNRVPYGLPRGDDDKVSPVPVLLRRVEMSSRESV
jgi:hypothetical protein